MTVKTLVASGADGTTTFSSLTAWANSIPATLTAPEELRVTNMSYALDTDIANGVFTTLAGKVTSAANYIRIYADPADAHNGVPRAVSGTGARFTYAGAGNGINVANPFFRIENIEGYGSSASGTGILIISSSFPTANDVRIPNCMMHDEATGTGYTATLIGANLKLDISGTIIFGNQRTWDTRGAASVIATNVVGLCKKPELGFVSDSETKFTNSYHLHAAGQANDDYWSGGNPTGSNNASSDTTAQTRFPTASLNNVAGASVFNSIVDGSEDFNLKAGTNVLVDAGVAVSGRTADAKGTPIPQGAAPDIGAFERVIQTAPNAPTIGTAVAGATKITTSFTAPAYNGGSPITSYTATAYKASDNTVMGTVTGPSSPLSVTGLTAGTAGYVKVKATNAIGTGAESAASNTVTPTAAVTPPTGAITSVTVDGQTVTVTGTTANTPTSGQASLTAASGGTNQGPVNLTLGTNTFTVTFTNVPVGSYSGEVVTLTNDGGSAGATGSQPFNIVAVTGSPSGPSPDAPTDTTAPVLTSPTGAATGVTTATIGVTTDEGNGTLYGLVNTSPTATVSAIKAGLSQAIGSTGAKGFSVTGLTGNTVYYAHFVQTDAANNTSAVVDSVAFTTQSAPVPAKAVYLVNGRLRITVS